MISNNCSSGEHRHCGGQLKFASASGDGDDCFPCACNCHAADPLEEILKELPFCRGTAPTKMTRTPAKPNPQAKCAFCGHADCDCAEIIAESQLE